MKILITGGAGFIGSHLADRLLAGGHEVRALDSLDPQVHPTGRPDYLDGQVELVVGDVADRAAVSAALEGADAVVHLAATVGVGQSMYEIERYARTNTIGTAILLEEVVQRRDRVSKLVVASSMSVYGEGQYANPRTGESGLAPPPRPIEQLRRQEWELREPGGDPLDPEATAETKPLAPQSVYAIGKRDQEELTLAVGAAYGIPAVALRLFNTYGPRQALANPYTGAVAIFATRLRNGRAPMVFEDGRQTRDGVHVADVARAFATVLESSAADGRVLNVGTGTAVSVALLATTIAETLGSSIEPEILGEFRPGDVRHCYADVRLARELVGFEAEIALADGIRDVVEWIGEGTPEDHADAALAELVSRGLISG